MEDSVTEKYNLAARAKIVMPLATMQIVAWGSIYISFSLFIEPIHRELHWSKNAITGAMSVGLLTSAMVQLALGRIIAWLGAYLTIGSGAVCAAVAMLLASTSNSVPYYYCAWILLGVSMALCFFEPAFAALMERMPEEFEGNVSALLLISGATSAIFVPLTHALIEGIGWRKTLLCFCAFNAGAALLAAGLRHTAGRGPARIRTTCQRKHGAEESAKFRREVLRSSRFWTLSLAFSANMFALTALVTQLPAVLASQRFPVSLTLTTLGIIGPAQAAGRLVQLGLFGKLPYPVVAIAAFTLFSAGAAGLQLFTSSGAVVLVSIAAIGLGSGIVTSIRATIAAILFDRRFYAHISGIIAAPASLARAAAPFAASLVASDIAGDEGVLDLVSASALISLWMIIRTLSGYSKVRD